MKRIISVIIAIQGTIFSFGQNSVNQVLAQIERNNPELKVVAAEVEADAGADTDRGSACHRE